MPKISWNDINDSDSSLQSDHEDPQDSSCMDKKASTVSGTSNRAKFGVNSKLKTACDELSLAKLDRHQKQQVWLYILNCFHQRADEVTLLLESSPFFSRVLRIKNVGWNVETTLENAKKLIAEGFGQKDIVIKFIYSNRNEDRQFQQKQRSVKMQKKVTYVEKTNQSPVLEKYTSLIEGTAKKCITAEQELNSTKKERQEKPKIKWVEKQKSLQLQDVKQPQLIERVQSPRRFNNLKQSKSPKRYKQKLQASSSTVTTPTKAAKQNMDEMPIKQTLTPNIKSQRQLNNIDQKVPALPKYSHVEQTKREQLQIQKQMREDGEARECIGKIKQNTKEGEAEGQSDEQSSEGEKQEPKKKKNKKKKNKGVKTEVKGQRKDCNNPFSFFASP